MANTPNFGTSVPVTIPVLSDAANIEKAFKMYHNGSEDGNVVFDNSIAGNLNKKAPIASPKFTGTVTFDTGATIVIPANSISSGMIVNGSIINEDISASAAISQSKIDGLSTSFAAKANIADPTFTGTVTANNLRVTGTLTANLTGRADSATSAVNYSGSLTKITVSSTQPSSPANGDVWIVIS